MENDRIKWNDRHGSRIDFHPVDTYLLQFHSQLKPGRVLDLACGRGRNAFFLAENGFEVIGADISDRGLIQLNIEAIKRKLSIQTLETDLDDPKELRTIAPFDSIICINFKLNANLIQLIPDILAVEGTFLWCSFNEMQAEVSGFPMAMALHPEEFSKSFQSLQLVDYKRFTDDSGFRDGYFFKKTN